MTVRSLFFDVQELKGTGVADRQQLPSTLQKRLIANAVDSTMRLFFPQKFTGLCHIYAILGANVLSIILNRNYIPVGGIALIDTGTGKLLELLDNDGFDRERGGTFHCWIESDTSIELVDFSFRHNVSYAATLGIKWKKKKCSYLWDYKDDVVLPGERHELPERFPGDKVWYRRTDAGTRFMLRHINENGFEHSKLTAHALKLLYIELQSHLKNRSSLKT